MNPKVSIVMPAYNCKQYIAEALDSILRQTYKNFELICVDDGSTDGTLDVLHDYEKQDNRIQILQQKNQYAGVARNNGMKLATGKYLMFLDADDVFEKGMLSYLVKKAERSQADIVNFGYFKFKDNIKKRSLIRIPYHNRKTVSPTTPELDLFQVTYGAAWNKLYRREFVIGTGLQFLKLKNHEDAFFVQMAAIEAERLLFLNKRFVYYRVGNSASLNNQLHIENIIKLHLAMYEELQIRGKYNFHKDSFESDVIRRYLSSFGKCRTRSDFYKLCKEISISFKAMHISEETPAVANHPARKLWASILKGDNEESLFHLYEYMRAEYIPKKSIEYRIGKKILSFFKLRNYS